MDGFDLRDSFMQTSINSGRRRSSFIYRFDIPTLLACTCPFGMYLHLREPGQPRKRACLLVLFGRLFVLACLFCLLVLFICLSFCPFVRLFVLLVCLFVCCSFPHYFPTIGRL